MLKISSMSRISWIALAAAMASAAGGIAFPTPGSAQKEAPAAPGFKFSPEVLAPAQIAKPALEAKDLVTAEPAVAQVEAAAKTDDDRYLAATLRLVLESQKVAAARAANQPADDTRLAAPYDALLANPKTPPADLPNIAFERGLISYKSRQFPQAATYFERARQLGSTDPRLATQLVMAKVNAGDTAGGMAELERIVTQTTASGGKADEQLYRFAISRTMQAKDSAGTLAWMRKYLAAYPTAKNWRDIIKIYGLQQGSLITPSKAQSLDLYRLMRATNALADQYDYEDYAFRANSAGLPYEAKTIVAEGRAKGKIPAGAGTGATILTAANKAIALEGSLAPIEARAKAASTGTLAAQTGDAQLGSGNYAKAIDLYRAALQKGGANANDVNTRLGIALAMTGDKASAKAAFGAVSGSPSADIAALWMTHLDAGSVPAPAA